MHEAERGLYSLKWDEYVCALRDLDRGRNMFFVFTAEARERAEAYLRVLGKWRGK
jgi:hypothetical protein